MLECKEVAGEWRAALRTDMGAMGEGYMQLGETPAQMVGSSSGHLGNKVQCPSVSCLMCCALSAKNDQI